MHPRSRLRSLRGSRASLVPRAGQRARKGCVASSVAAIRFCIRRTHSIGMFSLISMSLIAVCHTVICTRCSHLKRSRKLCFAVAIVPFAIGSASLPVESILAKNQIKNTPAEVHETWRRRAKQGNAVHAHQNFRPTLSLSRATRITLHLRHSYAVVPSCQASGEILAHRRLSLVLPNPAAQHLATTGHRYSRLSLRWFLAICRTL